MFCCMLYASALMATPNKLESTIISYVCACVSQRACLSFIVAWVACTPAHSRHNCQDDCVCVCVCVNGGDDRFMVIFSYSNGDFAKLN